RLGAVELDERAAFDARGRPVAGGHRHTRRAATHVHSGAGGTSHRTIAAAPRAARRRPRTRVYGPLKARRPASEQTSCFTVVRGAFDAPDVSIAERKIEALRTDC